MNKQLSTSMFLLGMAAMVWSFSTMSCGDDGPGGLASASPTGLITDPPPQDVGPRPRLYVSDVNAGPIHFNMPGWANPAEITRVNFVPASAGDVVTAVSLSGTAEYARNVTGWNYVRFRIEVLDQNGFLITNKDSRAIPFSPQIPKPFRIDLAGLATGFDSYTVVVSVYAPTYTETGSQYLQNETAWFKFTDMQFKAMTLEGIEPETQARFGNP